MLTLKSQITCQVKKIRVLIEEDQLKKAICQTCFLISHHLNVLNITMSKEEYRAIVKRIKSQKALVLLIVNLLFLPDSIIPDLPELVGKNKHIVILGNKIDLLPGDAENYLQSIKHQLKAYCASMGISTSDNKDIHLISAKTRYGIENLIMRLESTWKYKGDVYFFGMVNAGKSTLFNTILKSDYCKSRASDVIHKATISPWPGHIGRTFQANQTPKKTLVEFDPDSLSFGEDLGEDIKKDPSLDASQMQSSPTMKSKMHTGSMIEPQPSSKNLKKLKFMLIFLVFQAGLP
ncbi:nitric oxide-associated protein 1-like [Carassius carassius]|uniref:nitric oxide-associated protein 1-like n=1 Tax=Carassius carassius TaxID=217509 RepID=UPI002868EBA4|nr:nitric oxide-associated protein 1-like [Carassius carassius]